MEETIKHTADDIYLLSRYDIDSLVEFIQNKPEYKSIALQFDENLQGNSFLFKRKFLRQFFDFI